MLNKLLRSTLRNVGYILLFCKLMDFAFDLVHMFPLVTFICYFYSFTQRVNKEGYTPVNAACLNNHKKCLALLVQYGGSLERVSDAQRESAIASAHKNHHREMIKFINVSLKGEALAHDGRNLSESAADDKQKVRLLLSSKGHCGLFLRNRK